MRALWLALLLTGCTADDGETDAGDTDADADTDADTDSDTDADTDTDPEATASLSGRVLDADGQPVAGARVNICRTVCKTKTTDADGMYVYDALEPWQTSFYVIPAEPTDLIAPLVTLTLADQEARTIDVHLFEAPAPQTLPATAAEVEVAPGLFLTLGADTLEPAAFTELGDVVAGVAPPADKRLDIELDGEVVAAWYLEPFEAKAPQGAPIRVKNDFGLAAGEQVRVWAAGDPLVFSWMDAGTLVVSSDGQWLEGDAMLPILSTVALVKSGG